MPTGTTAGRDPLRHLATTMTGRDPHERGRTATTLELLFDLTFVIAFGTAADELAHAVVTGHVGSGVLGFCFATFAVSWAWINFSWFASAYDTDDWVYRLITMVQMAGVILLALGLPALFDSLAEGRHVDNRLMVAGYVVMRVPMIVQWLRAARSDPARIATVRIMVGTLVVAQAGWIALALADLAVGPTLAVVVVLVLVEVSGPAVAETRADRTPWHPHHIAERYGLLVIIALGEGLLGTTAALQVLLDEQGGSLDVVVLGVAGVGLTFGIWWSYFVVPYGDLLAAHPERSFGWGYGHVVVFGSVVAIGAGLHTAAYLLGEHSELTTVGTVLAVVVPLAVFTATSYVLYGVFSRSFDPFHLLLVAGSALTLVASVGMAGAGVDLVWCLLVLALTPWVTVVGYETVGHRHNAEVLAALRP